MMARFQQVAPKAIIQGFQITSLSLPNGMVSLNWTNGGVLFEVEGTPDLQLGPWSTIGNKTTAHTATFPQDFNHFFRIVGSNSLPISITHTNPQTLTWSTPDTDVSDSLQTFTIKRSTDGGVTYPTTVGTRPAGGPYTIDDNTPIPQGTVFTYDVFETTANGVVVPYAPVSAVSSQPGSVIWTTTLGVSSGSQLGRGPIACDSNGFIYLAGQFFGTVDFSGTGGVQGVSKLTSHNAAKDLFIAKYTSAGVLVWVKAYGIDNQNVGPTCIALDGSGNIVIGGQYHVTINLGGQTFVSHNDPNNPLNHTADCFVVKYDSSGNHVWSISFGAEADDFVTSVGADSNGNVLACGTMYIQNQQIVNIGGINRQYFAGGNTFFLVQFTPNGSAGLAVANWIAATFQSLGALADFPFLAVDKRINPVTHLPYDNIFAVFGSAGPVTYGSTDTTLSGTTYPGSVDVLSEWSSSGALITSKIIVTGASSQGTPSATAKNLSIDSNGDIVFSGGMATGSASGLADFGNGSVDGGEAGGFVAKYSGTDFHLLWRAITHSSGGYKGDSVVTVTATSIDSLNNIYFSGYLSCVPTRNVDFKDSSDVVQKQIHTSSFTDTTVWVAKYSPSGNISWVNSYGPQSSFGNGVSLGDPVLDGPGSTLIKVAH